VISGFRREVAESCALLGYYAASSDNLLPTFRENLSVSSSGLQNSQKYKDSLSLRMGPIDCPETSVKMTTIRCAMTQKSAVLKEHSVFVEGEDLSLCVISGFRCDVNEICVLL
jgi:hypothetical protein